MSPTSVPRTMRPQSPASGRAMIKEWNEWKDLEADQPHDIIDKKPSLGTPPFFQATGEMVQEGEAVCSINC
jgi:hypothetical protein